MEDIPNNIIVLEFFQETDLTDGGTWNALVLGFEADLLERYDLFCVDVPRLIYDTIGSCSWKLEELCEESGNTLDKLRLTFACGIHCMAMSMWQEMSNTEQHTNLLKLSVAKASKYDLNQSKV